MASLCICNGVYRSGSTWSFNVCREIFRHWAIQTGGKSDSRYLDAGPLEQFIMLSWPSCSAASVIKAHHLGRAAMTAVSRGDAKAVYTYRDPRDCVASDLGFTRSPIEHSMRRVSQTFEPLRLYRTTPRVLLVRYEDMMQDRTREIGRIAKYLGVEIDAASLQHIDAKTNLQSSEKVCQSLKHRPAGQVLRVTTHLVDPATHLHENHIQGGTVGRWRYDLSSEQAAYVTEFFRFWLLQLGYETPQSLQQILRSPTYAGDPSIPMQQTSTIGDGGRVAIPLGSSAAVVRAMQPCTSYKKWTAWRAKVRQPG